MEDKMAVYLSKEGGDELLGYTNWDRSDVRRALRSVDGVYSRDCGSLRDTNCAEILVYEQSMADKVFAQCGRYEPKAANAATDKQVEYLVKLGVKIEKGMTKTRASELIDAVKGGYLGSVGGWFVDGSN